jgi:hypothetical protein
MAQQGKCTNFATAPTPIRANSSPCPMAANFSARLPQLAYGSGERQSRRLAAAISRRCVLLFGLLGAGAFSVLKKKSAPSAPRLSHEVERRCAPSADLTTQRAKMPAGFITPVLMYYEKSLKKWLNLPSRNQ